MTHPEQPGGWTDPSWSTSPPQGYPAQSYPTSGQPAGYPDPYLPGGYPAYGYPPVPVAPPTNGLAVASMVVSIVGAVGLVCYGLGGYLGVVGAILGHVSRRQIRERGGNGDGMALAGIITGWIAAGLAVIATVIIIILIVAAVNDQSFDSGY
jgi:Domain of unknown function (DUF4190)